MKDDSSFQVGFTLPISQSIATGIFFTLAALGLCWAFQWPALWAFASGGVVTFVAWMNLFNRMLYVIEFVLRQDINGDGVIGTPMPRPPAPTTRVELIKKDQDNSLVEGDYIELPGEPEKIALLADGLLRGYSLTVDEWTGQGKPFKRNQFVSVRDELLHRGLIAPLSDKSNKSGYGLTVVGRHVMTKLAKSTTPPPFQRL